MNFLKGLKCLQMIALWGLIFISDVNYQGVRGVFFPRMSSMRRCPQSDERYKLPRKGYNETMR